MPIMAYYNEVKHVELRYPFQCHLPIDHDYIYIYKKTMQALIKGTDKVRGI